MYYYMYYVQRSLHPQYHDWGALEQGTEPPTAPQVPQHKKIAAHCSGCVFTVCVCTLDGLIAEHKFQVWVTYVTSRSLSLIMNYFFVHSIQIYYQNHISVTIS